MSNASLFVVVSECAWYPVEGTAPSGTYGVDWCVMRAATGPDAVRQAPGMVIGQLPISGDADAVVLSEKDARAAFAE